MSLFRKLWENHPTGDFPCSTNGKKNFDNQCAIRMGSCFERSGIPTRRWPVRRCWQHKGEDSHILAAEELANTLTKITIPGITIVEKYSGAEGMKRIDNRKGIVFFKDFYGPGMQGDHIDLWNGWRLSSFSSVLSIYTPFGSHYEKGAVWFWETV